MTVDFCLHYKNPNLCKSYISFIQNIWFYVEWFTLIEHLFQLSDLSFQVTCTLLHIPSLRFFSCKPFKLGIPACLLCNRTFIRLISGSAMTSCFIYNRNVESYFFRSYFYSVKLIFFDLDFYIFIFTMKPALSCLMDIHHMMSWEYMHCYINHWNSWTINQGKKLTINY